MIKAIIFDFDGVILESAIIKSEAFYEVVKEYPKHQADAFIDYHMNHMGISRHVKFKYFIESILNEEYSEEKERALADRFEQIVYNKILNCVFVPGAEEFLLNNHSSYDFYIASGTPEDEMRRIVKNRKLDVFFKGVYGTPKKKEEIIEGIKADNGYDKRELIFVGDAKTDMKAAELTGLVFVGRNTPENKETFINVKYRVDNLMEIEGIIEELNAV